MDAMFIRSETQKFQHNVPSSKRGWMWSDASRQASVGHLAVELFEESQLSDPADWLEDPVLT